MVTLQARKVAQQMRETFTGSNKTMFTAGEAQIDALIDGFKSQETELKKQAEQAKKLLTEQFKDNDEAKELIDGFHREHDQDRREFRQADAECA